jgi:hypothetical protein
VRQWFLDNRNSNRPAAGCSERSKESPTVAKFSDAKVFEISIGKVAENRIGDSLLVEFLKQGCEFLSFEDGFKFFGHDFFVAVTSLVAVSFRFF